MKSEQPCKLINRIPDLRLLISSLPGSTLRTHVQLLDKPRDVNKHSQSLDIKIHLPIILPAKSRSDVIVCLQSYGTNLS